MKQWLRGPGLHPHHPHDGSQPSGTPGPPIPSSGPLHIHGTHNISAGKHQLLPIMSHGKHL